ncbi:hypothetical protein IWQ60_011723 [Tieghemiomyces parasiticus]|uniref:Uncharacterized protein n=1 Tax=Tieghemiomyces parasiticus TaxID=78921 RepID=A0A9W8DLD7_9FUNG|nr:hypothetical protein IWQ60_011723 [Tieghemiomyces parasiticus]
MKVSQTLVTTALVALAALVPHIQAAPATDSTLDNLRPECQTLFTEQMATLSATTPNAVTAQVLRPRFAKQEPLTAFQIAACLTPSRQIDTFMGNLFANLEFDQYAAFVPRVRFPNDSKDRAAVTDDVTVAPPTPIGDILTLPDADLLARFPLVYAVKYGHESAVEAFEIQLYDHPESSYQQQIWYRQASHTVVRVALAVAAEIDNQQYKEAVHQTATKLSNSRPGTFNSGRRSSWTRAVEAVY